MHLLLFTYGQKPNINTFFRSCFHAKVEKTNFFKHSNKLISHLNKLGFVLAIFPLTSFEIIIRPCHHRLCSKLVRTEVKYSISWVVGTFTLTIMSRINYAKINGCRQTWGEFLYLVGSNKKRTFPHKVTFLSQLYQLVPRTATTTTSQKKITPSWMRCWDQTHSKSLNTVWKAVIFFCFCVVDYICHPWG